MHLHTVLVASGAHYTSLPQWRLTDADPRNWRQDRDFGALGNWLAALDGHAAATSGASRKASQAASRTTNQPWSCRADTQTRHALSSRRHACRARCGAPRAYPPDSCPCPGKRVMERLDHGTPPPRNRGITQAITELGDQPGSPKGGSPARSSRVLPHADRPVLRARPDGAMGQSAESRQPQLDKLPRRHRDQSVGCGRR
jgi:hypothetical protein